MPSWVRALTWTLLALLLTGCSQSSGPDASNPPQGTITTLSDEDTILVSDLLGSAVVEVTGSGNPRGRFAAYPYGATRFDSTTETNRYASVPRDTTVAPDAMGARFYAADLGVWTSADPAAVSSPELFVTTNFAAANAYAYAQDSPLLATDRDGHFPQVLVGFGVGALMGGGMEAARQYLDTGHISDWGRIGAAAVGGAVSGSIAAACPAAGLTSFFGSNAASGAAGGIAQRLVASGGQSAGSLREVAYDAGTSVLMAGIFKAGGALVKSAVTRMPAVARAAKAPSAPMAAATDGHVNLASPQRTTHILDGDATGGGHLWPGKPDKSVLDIATDPKLTWQWQKALRGKCSRMRVSRLVSLSMA